MTKRKTDVATKFIEDENGLPYVKATKEGVMFVQTVRKNYEGFTKEEVESSVFAREDPGLIGHPSERDLKYLVISNLGKCPVTTPDVDSAHKSFGPILEGCM